MSPSYKRNARCCGRSRSARASDVFPSVFFGFSSEPIVDLESKSSAVFYSECLARLRFDDAPLVSAGNFVTQMEAFGECSLIDIAMLDLVLEALGENSDLVLGCNVSPHTVADALSWSSMIKRLERAGSVASRLILEITEGAPLDEIPCAGIRLKAAKTLGCRIAIDDFGVGAASLPRLFRVEAVWDIIKLDKSCFGTIHSDRFVVNVLRPTFELASCLAPFVVIEGVETEDHLQAARAVGAQYVQGWHFPHSQHQSFVLADDSFTAKIAEYLANIAKVSSPIDGGPGHALFGGVSL